MDQISRDLHERIRTLTLESKIPWDNDAGQNFFFWENLGRQVVTNGLRDGSIIVGRSSKN